MSRPQFPKRAVITAGMPYGNKDLHFGHIGGVFVHADVFARFLRDSLSSKHLFFPALEATKFNKSQGWLHSGEVPLPSSQQKTCFVLTW